MTTPASQERLSGSAEEIRAVFGQRRHSWSWLLALGILFIVLGVIALGMSVTMTIVTVLFFGALLLVGGAFQLVDAFRCRGWKSTLLHVLIALLYLAAGFMLVTEPVAGSLVLTAFLGGAFVVIGVLRLLMGFQLRGSAAAWGWIALAGLASLVLGGLILFQWPASALWLIGLLVAIELIFHGWAYVMLALAIRALNKRSGGLQG